jgi:hypothetical protein
MCPNFIMMRYVTCANDVQEGTQRLMESLETSIVGLQNVLQE